MSRLQGPALVVVNDAVFSEDDWQGIQRIGRSGKEHDTAKTGRFGLGFNSVYNVTDFPTLLTGHRIGFFDPHGDTVADSSIERPGVAYGLDDDIWTKCPDLLAPFRDFGLSHRATSVSGTVFRLPLRTEEQASRSEISDQPFTSIDFDHIIGKFKDQLGGVLLFLKNVLDIEIARIAPNGVVRSLLSARTHNRDAVDLARGRLRQLLATDYTRLLEKLVAKDTVESVSEFEHHVEMTCPDSPPLIARYLVVHGFFLDSNGQIEACARQMAEFNEKAIPLAGAAARIDLEADNTFEGRLYCVLPLPVSSPVSSCHVNGYFDLQADRQGLFQDQGAGGRGAVRVEWNRLLVEHCCSEAVARLCTRLSENAKDNAAPLYDHWPRVPATEASLIDCLPRHVYAHLCTSNCVAAGGDAIWRAPKDVLLLSDSASEAVRLALLSDEFAIANPAPPGFVSIGFNAAGAPFTELTPARLRGLLRVSTDPKVLIQHAHRPCLRNRAWVAPLLGFCLSDRAIDDLLGVPLALMTDGTLRAFGLDPKAPICLGGKVERELFARMTQWFIDSPLEEQLPLQESKPAGLLRLTPQLVISNLTKVLPPVGSDGRVEIRVVGGVAPSDDWLVRTFEYMAAHAKEITLDAETINKLALVPDQFGFLQAMGSPNTPLLPTTEEHKSLTNALTAIGVPLVSGSEELMKAIRAFVVAFDDKAIWRLSPRDLIDTLSAIAPKGSETELVTSRDHADALLDYLGSNIAVRGLKDKIADRVVKLKSLRLFPTTSGEFVSLIEDDHHIPADFDLPEVNTDIGLLECGRNGKWAPLYEVLGVKKLTRARFLSQSILPRMSAFRVEEIHEVLLWLRHNRYAIKEEESKDSADELLLRLGETVPVSCTDGATRPARFLYHPDAQFVEALLGDRVGFPDTTVYCDRPDLWIALFEELGMARTPRPDHILGAIDNVLNSKRTNDDKASHLADIAEYLNANWDSFEEESVISDPIRPANCAIWRLSDALSFRAWLPALGTAPRDYPNELLFSAAGRFFKPSDMLARESLDLAGSILPVCGISGLFRIQSSIGLRVEPSLEDVQSHFENSIILAEMQEGPVSERLVSIFRRVYRYLGRLFGEVQAPDIDGDERVASIRARFASRPCLYDVNKRLWPPMKCFEEEVSRFLGLRARVRDKASDLDFGLVVLGRRLRPDAADYAALFHELATTHRVTAVPEENRSLLRTAYTKAAELGHDDVVCGSPVLLDTGRLADPAEVVLDDAPWLSERARAAGLHFLDPQLEITVSAFDVQRLSSAVYECPVEMVESNEPGFVAECEVIESRLHSPQLCDGVYRLLRASDYSVLVPKLKQFFSAICVVPVARLETTLVWTDGDAPIEGSRGVCDVVYEQSRSAVVVSEDVHDVLYERIVSVLVNELPGEGHELGNCIAHFVTILRAAPDAIDRLLTKLHVRTLPIASDEAQVQADETDGFIDEGQEAAESPSNPVSDHEMQPARSGVMNSSTDHITPHRGDGKAIPQPYAVPEEEVVQESDVAVGAGHQDDESPTGVTGKTASPEPPRLAASAEAQAPISAEQRGPRDGTSSQVPPSSPEHPWRDRRNNTSSEENVTESSDVASPRSQSRLIFKRSQPQRGRARTYVTPRSETKRDETPQHQERRRRVDQAAIQHVLKYEKDRARLANEMPHSNEGYDIESFRADGSLERLIEVKGLSGPWSEFGVPVSRSQFRKASTERARFWLYVIEFALEPSRARVIAIQDPAELVDEFWFDNGWRDLSKERGGPGLDAALKEGSLVLVDGARRGTVKRIHKRGLLMHLDIGYEDNTREQLVFSPRRVQVLPDEEA